MAQSSDEIIKRELSREIGTTFAGLTLRIFPESSNDDQKPFSEGGLTFGVNGVSYGSCDACWLKDGEWKDPLTGKNVSVIPAIALEGTDALNRGSSGNAQYQRFHHALGAVKAGLIGVYYLKKGADKIQEDLFGMAYYASKYEKGVYLIIDDLDELKRLISVYNNKVKLKIFLCSKLRSMLKIFRKAFREKYGSSWTKFAKSRSTIIKKGYIIKYSGRMKRNFTESSQRAGHIAVGEMYLTKYFFPKSQFYYLWPRMNKEDIEYLDAHKSDDKEWKLLRNEEGVKIITMDDLEGVPDIVKEQMKSIKDLPLKNTALSIYNEYVDIIARGLQDSTIRIRKELLI
ncbi:MAG: hypothetical protein ABII64_02325 [Elusimicrobiota bacterium]